MMRIAKRPRAGSTGFSITVSKDKRSLRSCAILLIEPGKLRYRLLLLLLLLLLLSVHVLASNVVEGEDKKEKSNTHPPRQLEDLIMIFLQ